MGNTRKQTQIIVSVTLILDDQDKDSEDVAYDRLATALYDIDDHTFEIHNMQKIVNTVVGCS